MQLESSINNYKMQAELQNQEKASLEASVAEHKNTSKGTKEKVKQLNKDLMLLRATYADVEKAKTEAIKEVERLKADLAQRESAALAHEVSM